MSRAPSPRVDEAPKLTAANRGSGLALDDPLPLRVGFAGRLGRELLGSRVEAVNVAPGPSSRNGDSRADASASPVPSGSFDALVIDPDAGGLTRAELERIVALARESGATVVGLDPGGGELAWEGLEQISLGSPRAGPAEAIEAPPPLDPKLWGPVRFQRDDVAGYVAVARKGSAKKGIRQARGLLASGGLEEPVLLRCSNRNVSLPRGVLAGPPLGGAPKPILKLAHKRLGVLDHPGFHASEWERSGWIVRLCAAGVPVVAAEISAELAELLGEELTTLLRDLSPRDLTDLDDRERISVALRRVALRDHSVEARWRQIAALAGIDLPPRPLVSVILATRREEWLAHGLGQALRQNYEPRELVVCLHGDGFSEGVEDEVRQVAGAETKIVRAGEPLTLGDVLNAGIEVSEGQLISKMDDDDYYSNDHLWDLVLALEYAGADLTGKAAEFVYLDEIDVTVRQVSHDVDTRLAGGGMMARRAALVEQGGWPQRTRGEDLALIRMFAGNDRAVIRVPPHGYILNRHGRDHTWRPAIDYFLFRSEQQWRGLRFDETAIDEQPRASVGLPVAR